MPSPDSGRFNQYSDHEKRIQKLEEKSEKYNVDLYVGSGQNDPSLTTRMALMEEVVGKIGSNLSKIVWLLVALLSTLVADYFHKGGKF